MQSSRDRRLFLDSKGGRSDVTCCSVIQLGVCAAVGSKPLPLTRAGLIHHSSNKNAKKENGKREDRRQCGSNLEHCRFLCALT